MTVAMEPASFRDPSGFIFTRDSTLYRQVAPGYSRHYERLMDSGLYQALTECGLLIPHFEEPCPAGSDAFRILRPEHVPFISYPYEWCFSQLRDAALATLAIQAEALKFGMWLKDASAYNIQFRDGRPTLIDTLSFEIYEEGSPWPAYRQFCQHFLAPLALMSKTDIRLGMLLRTYIDGVPLDLASRLLPGKTRLDGGLLAHIHLHGAAQKRYEGSEIGSASTRGRFSKTALLGLIDSLQGAVRKLTWQPSGTTWANYYNETNYTDAAMASKRSLVAEMLGCVEPRPNAVWDLGANTGEFSRLAAKMGARTVAWDIDPGAVEKGYLAAKEASDERMLPLLVDLTNPSPDLGWELVERRSLINRGPADVVMALALIHHLAIGNNVPLTRIARFFRSVGEWLIVEFVPKSDSQVRRLLSSREDIFPGYTREGFEADFSTSFEIMSAVPVPGSERTLYLMRGRG